MVKRRQPPAVLITDAPRSQDEELRIRQTRYVLMMSVRVVAVVAAAVLVTLKPPLLWLWLALCAIGMVVVPWVAVVLANDRLPKERHRWRRHRRSEAEPVALRAAPGQIDGDVVSVHEDAVVIGEVVDPDGLADATDPRVPDPRADG